MVIFLYGEDNFRSRLKLNELKAKYLKEIDKSGSGLKVLDGAKANYSEIREAISPASLLSKKRLIIVENVFVNKEAKIFEKLSDYLKVENEKKDGNIIIFWEANIKMKKARNTLTPVLFSADGYDKPLNKSQAEFFKFLAEQKYSSKPFNSLSAVEASAWVKKEIIKRGGKITLKAADFLVGLVGFDGWQISSEIDKLLNYKAASQLTEAEKEITEEDVKKLVRGNFSDNIFSLTDALSAKNKALAVKLLEELKDSGLDGHYLLTMIIRQSRILLQVRQGLDSGLDQRKMASLFKLHPFVLQKALGQARNFNLASLKNIFSRLAEIDYLSKTGRGDIMTNLNILIARI